MKKIKNIAIYIVVLLAIIVLSENVYYRFDLSSEGRYTLSETTKAILSELDEELFVEVYLDGDMPSSFIRMKDRLTDLMKDFNKESGKSIHVKFVNISAINNKDEKDKFIENLVSRGIQPTNINRKNSDESLSQQIIFPGLTIWNSKKEMSVNILKNNPAFDAETNINSSIESLEYELVNAINVITMSDRKKIGFLYGHDEIRKAETADMGMSLADFYDVNLVDCEEVYADIDKYSALVIAQPRKDFSEKDKFVIDQYIMNGGSTLWLVDEVDADIDSLRVKPEIFAFFKPLNIEDMLFQYGVRINPNLVLDGQCVLIPVNTSLAGEAPKFTPAPWYYSPLVYANINHPIGKNLNPIRLDFANTIDLVGESKTVKKEVILQTSQYSRLVNVPHLVSLGIVEEKMTPEVYNKSFLPLGVLLEGKFTSAFKHRDITNYSYSNYRKESKEAKMIIISDGDIIRNELSGKGENLQIIPLGYDRFTKQTYGNKDFLLNAINYLCDNKGLMQLRSREFKLRILDKTRIKSERNFWQVVNVLIPLILLVVGGFIMAYIRKKRYNKS